MTRHLGTRQRRRTSLGSAWGAQPFENPDAMRWVAELDASSDLRVVERAVDAIEAGAGAADIVTCREALAAGEVLAAMHGRPHPALPRDVRAWIERVRPRIHSDIVRRAELAVRRLLASVAPDVTEHGDDVRIAWRAGVEELLDRLAEPKLP